MRGSWGRCLAAVLLFAALDVAAQPTAKDRSLLSATPAIPDISTFMQIGGNSALGCSADGRTVYIASSQSGAQQVYRLTESGWPYQLTTFDDGIDFFALSWDGTMAIVGASTGGSEQSQLFLMDTQTGRLVQLTNDPKVQYGSVVWARDNRSIYYRSNADSPRDFFIYKMDVATGKSTRVFGDTAGVRGSNGIAELSQDGGKLIVSNWRSNTANDLYLLDLATGKYDKLNADPGNVAYAAIDLMPDNRTVWLLSNDNKDGISRLAKMVVGKTGVEFVNDGWLDPKWEVENLIVSANNRYVLATYNQDGYVRCKLRDLQSGKDLPAPPLDGVVGAAFVDDAGNAVLSFNGPTRAPDVWRWEPKTRKLTQLTFASYAGIDRGTFSEPKLVHYRSFDSLEIPAFLYLPKGHAAGTPVPFVIDAHGGPEGQSQPYFTRNIQYLLLHGYGVLLPNVRGSSGYGRGYLALDDYKNRRNSLKDYKSAADWLVANGYSKPGQLAIRGTSYGGYVVYGMVTEYPDLFSAAMASVGIVNFQTFLQNTAAYRRALREAEYGPLSDSTFLKEVSPIYKADRIKTPLLITAGVNDPRVPVEEARQMIAAVQKNGGVVDSLIFPDEGHGTSKRPNVIAEYRKQVEFLDRYIKHADQAEIGKQ